MERPPEASTNPENCPVCGQPDNCGDCNHLCMGCGSTTVHEEHVSR